MEEKESALTKAVRERVVNAVENGEDLTEKMSEITLDVAKKAYEWVKDISAEIEAVAKETLKGAIVGADEPKEEAADDISDGTTQMGIKTAYLAERTTEQALNSLKETGDNAVEMVKEVVKGVLGAVKEILEENKT